jgi:hypothetical protein
MRKHINFARLFMLSFFFLISIRLVVAQPQTSTASQEPAPPDAAEGMAFARTMQGDMELVMELQQELTDSPVKDLSFTAQVSVESEQMLADGTHIARKTNGALYRDGSGRVRQELTLSVPGVPPSAEPGKMVILIDPSSGAYWTLVPAAKMAMKMTLPPISKRAPNSESQTTGNPGPVLGFGGQGTPEKLGTQNMEGVTATGTRYTLAVPAGQLGNDQPLQIVSERWYSAELHMSVLLKRTDPISGSKTLQVSDIRRTEPDAALFSVPADYTVREMMLPTDAEAKKPVQP